jgi:hypothetical protein
MGHGNSQVGELDLGQVYGRNPRIVAGDQWADRDDARPRERDAGLVERADCGRYFRPFPRIELTSENYLRAI